MTDETSTEPTDGAPETPIDPTLDAVLPEAPIVPDVPPADDAPVAPADEPPAPAPVAEEVRDHRDWRPGDYQHPEAVEIDGIMQLTGNMHYFDGSGRRLA